MFSLPSTISGSPEKKKTRNPTEPTPPPEHQEQSFGAFALPSIVSTPANTGLSPREEGIAQQATPSTATTDTTGRTPTETTTTLHAQDSTLPERPDNPTSRAAHMQQILHEHAQQLLTSQNDSLAQFDSMSPLDQERYQVYMRTKLANTDNLGKHLSQLPMNPRINPSATHIISLVMKEMTGDIMLLALQVRMEKLDLYNHTLSQGQHPPMDQPQGPITVHELREAYRRWRERDAKIGRDKWTHMKKNAWRR